MKVREGVFCDTSFFIRLLDKNDPLHHNAKGYFKYLAERDFQLMISTIAIAEYCVRGDVNELPLKNLQIIPLISIMHSEPQNSQELFSKTEANWTSMKGKLFRMIQNSLHKLTVKRVSIITCLPTQKA